MLATTFEDPFFFDLLGFQDGLAFTGMDFFAGFDVSAIVMEYPSARLRSGGTIGVFAKTSINGQQRDRIGRPAINTVLIPSDRKDEFNQTLPHRDAVLYGEDVTAAITGLSGDEDYAAMIAGILLPDILTVDQSSTAGFLNGRQLDDDVIDIELGVLSNGGVTTDNVDTNDATFSEIFPYLAPSNASGDGE